MTPIIFTILYSPCAFDKSFQSDIKSGLRIYVARILGMYDKNAGKRRSARSFPPFQTAKHSSRNNRLAPTATTFRARRQSSAQWKVKVAADECFIYAEPRIACDAGNGACELRAKPTPHPLNIRPRGRRGNCKAPASALQKLFLSHCSGGVTGVAIKMKRLANYINGAIHISQASKYTENRFMRRECIKFFQYCRETRERPAGKCRYLR